ncbi:MAG: DNA-binding protein [Leptolyngbyaceae cyanobacterium SL_7_1]|nr:DNA-binding protein [Leptolyngbyaceae cyanobacterium SL_7_1]
MKQLIIASISAIAVATGLHAQAQPIPIERLQNQQGTTISGTVRSIVGNEFVLSDGTGEVIVDAGPRWYHTVNISEGEQVTVVGEYDDDDFDAFQITRESGEVIVIRSGPGRPPWAGGPNRRN